MHEGSLPSQAAAALAIRALVERLRQVDAAGMARQYNEARTVNEFVLPLFEALGWDIHNRTSSHEVLPEQSAAAGRADWTLSIRGIARVLVEAKSLSTNLSSPQYARQAINYSYSRGVTWAVLTNFRELHVYNAEWALPDPELSRFLSFRWEDLEADLDRLWLLSRPAVEAGGLDHEAERYGRKRRKTPVGDQLFGDLLEYRFSLRRSFQAYNPSIPIATIDHAVQRLLDRLIFIRAAEDREIEPPHLWPLLRSLEQSKKRSTLWDRLLRQFREWERDYDSQLFEVQPLDHLGTEIQPIWDTIAGLYETDSGLVHYDFRGIDADVLGGVYEQYLSHLARLERTPARRDVKSESAEGKRASRGLRKARGVYYTPLWMVRFIVNGALGPLLDSCTDEQVRHIRILDPACGSGSFLVETFRVLSRYWEAREKPKTAQDLQDLRLSILRDNLFGIDLDSQAVEIAQLNLLLAALNSKSRLPDLTGNFVVGNALFDLNRRMGTHKDDGSGWLKPADVWAAFPTAHQGFDAVVMNPPYYDLQLHPYQQAALRDAYPEMGTGREDILYYFLARAVDLTRKGGQIGCVVARYWLDSRYADRLRGHLAQQTRVREIIDFRSYQPFGRDVAVNAAIVLAEAGGPTETARMLTPATDGIGVLSPLLMESMASLEPGPPAFDVAVVPLSAEPWRNPTHRSSTRVKTVRLGDIAFLTQGIKTGRNDIYVVSPALARARELEPEVLRPVLEGEDIGAFALIDTGRRLIYLDGSVDLAGYPNTLAYLEEHREELLARAEASRSRYPWWRLQRPRRSPAVDAALRLIAPQLATAPRFSAISSVGSLAGAVGLTDTLMLAVIDDFSPYYVLAVLNSTYGADWTRLNAKVKRAGYREFVATSLAEFPVPVLDPSSQELLAEYARQLQIELADPPYRAFKGRFDDRLNESAPRSALIAEATALLTAEVDPIGIGYDVG